ncbi:hypothetical protein VNO80_00935 [Phaseolus coccineus]|uniref:Uncharacterized protein n=1 Tax=Phaseolus coccineus TaxID=3886 RepID=A0AAN9RSH7_PHACN
MWKDKSGVEPIKLWELGKQLGTTCFRDEEQVIEELVSIEVRDVEVLKRYEEGLNVATSLLSMWHKDAFCYESHMMEKGYIAIFGQHLSSKRKCVVVKVSYWFAVFGHQVLQASPLLGCNVGSDVILVSKQGATGFYAFFWVCRDPLCGHYVVLVE